MASPFAAFRRNQRVLLAVFGVICMIVFVVGYNLDDILRGGRRGGGGGETVVTWSNGTLDEQGLSRHWTQYQLASELMRRLAQETAIRKGTPKFELAFEGASRDDDIVDKLLLAQKAHEMGIVVNDQVVLEYIESFTDRQIEPREIHRFVKELLEDRRTRFSPDQLFEYLRLEIAARTVQNLARSYVGITTPAVHWKYYNRVNRRIKAECLPINVADFVAETREPSEAEILELYEKYKNQPAVPSSPEPGFMNLKKIALQYYKVDYKGIEKTLIEQLTPEEIQAEYDARIARGDFKNPELPLPLSPSSKADDTKQDDATKIDESPTDAPKADEPKADAPKDDAPKADEPKADEPKADEPKADAPKADEPKADEPKADEPKADEPKADEPKADEPKADEPKADEPKADEPKLGESSDDQRNSDSGGVCSGLIAQEPTANPGVDGVADTSTVQESTTNEDPQPSGQGDAKSNAEDNLDSPATESNPEETTQDRPKFKPLSEVRDAVISSLVRPKAQKEMERRALEVKRIVDKFSRDFHDWELYHTEPGYDGPGEPTLDIAGLAAQYDVEAKSMDLTDQFGFIDHELGIRGFVAEAFSDRLEVNRPREWQAPDRSATYIWWKTMEKAAYVPDLNEVRTAVVAAWKRHDALRLAKDAAESRAKLARDKDSLKSAFEPEIAEKVFETSEFSWIGSILPLQFRGAPMLSEVAGVDTPGAGFMEKVFALREGEVGVATNQPETVVYVVRIAKEVLSESDRRERFLVGKTFGYEELAFRENQELYFQWIVDLRQQMNVNWLRTPRSLGQSE